MDYFDVIYMPINVHDPCFIQKNVSIMLLIYVRAVHMQQIKTLRTINESIYTCILEMCMMLNS